ncbi:hypothetical protein ACKGJN_11270 [Gillisia sp. Q332]|uniref:hypothetical protein n=1 Tax=Gillisia xinjiangensis TaxID=3384765 RepID=UPI00391AAB96
MSKKDSFKPDIQIEDYGISISNPILSSSIRAGYNFCDRLKSLDEDLEYTRKGSDSSPKFDEPVDMYEFKYCGKTFCTVYIYAYHTEDIEEVPDAFIKLGEEDINLDDLCDGFEIVEEGGEGTDEIFQALMLDEKENHPPREELFESLVRNILAKQSKDFWVENDEQWLRFQIEELGANPLIEPLILQEWEDYLKRTHRPHQEFFVQSFLPSYHHGKLAAFLPKKAQEQNLEIQKAYNSLLKMINSIQFVAGEDLQERIESERGAEQGYWSLLKQCSTKFCVLQLNSDISCNSNIDFWLDADIFEMLNLKQGNALLRSIYKLTPGLDEQITCKSLTYDCEAWFIAMKEEAKHGVEHRVVKAEEPDKAIDL